MIALFVLTAATDTVRRAPVKLPTTAISAALNSCPKIAVAATGRANCGILFQIDPCSISSCLLFATVSNACRSLLNNFAPHSIALRGGFCKTGMKGFFEI